MGVRITSILGTAILFCTVSFGQQMPSQSAQSSVMMATAPTAMPTQSVSATGLLPIFGVDFKSDGSWFDDGGFPSQSANFPNLGTSTSFQKVWDALKPGGFNVLRVDVDLSDARSAANRTANLCAWSKNNGVMLVLVLRGNGKAEYADKVGAFVQALTTLMAQDTYKPAYDQIAFYELEPDWNNPSLRKDPSANQDLLLKAAAALKKAEGQNASLIAKPIAAGASLDYEFIAAGAIAGTQFKDDSYQHAYSSLLDWLKPIIGSTDFDAVSIAWLPGTISTGGPENLQTVVGRLSSDLGGKRLILRTGFSTAFHSSDVGRQYYMNAFSTLASVRASSPDSKFVGVVFQEALNAPKPAANSAAQAAMPKWDWSAKAAELSAMWGSKKDSPDMSWWLSSIDSGMGLLSAQADSIGNDTLARSSGLDALNQVAQAVASASASMPAAPTTSGGMNAPANAMPANPTATPGTATNLNATTPGQMPADPNSQQAAMGAAPAMGGQSAPSGAKGFAATLAQTFQAKSNQGLGSLLDIVFQRLGTTVQTVGTGGGGSGGRAQMMPSPGGIPSDPSGGMMGSPNSAAGMNSNMGAAPGASGFNSGAATDPSMATNAAMPAAMPGAGMPSADMSGGMASGMNATASTTGMGTLPTGATPVAGTNAAIGPGMSPAGASATAMPGTPMTGASGVSTASPGTVLTSSPSSNPVSKAPTPAMQSVKGKLKGATLPTSATSAPTGGMSATATTASNPRPTPTPSSGAVVGASAAAAPAAANASLMIASAAGAGANPVANSTPAVNASPVSVGPPPSPNLPTPVAKAQAPPGFATIGTITPQGILVAGQPAQLSVPISNPNSQGGFSNIKAMLMIDGKPVQTQTLAALAPLENRSVAFPQVVVAQPGQHEVKIGIQLQRPDSKSQMGIFSQFLLVQPAPIVGAGPPAAAKVAHPVSGAAPSSAAATPNASATASLKRAELTLSPADLTFSPSAVIVGQPVDLHVTVRNTTDVPTKAGALVLQLVADGKVIVITQPPLQFSIPGKGTYQANWRAVMPAGTLVQLLAYVTADGREVPGKSQAAIQLKTQLPANRRTTVSTPVKKIP